MRQTPVPHGEINYWLPGAVIAKEIRIIRGGEPCSMKDQEAEGDIVSC